MKIARYGTEYCCIDESNMDEFVYVPKMHLIKLDFLEPTRKKVLDVLNLYPSTKRFFFSDHIKIYNDILRTTDKKYYIENTEHDGLITFFKRNNKCILNFSKLKPREKSFALEFILTDILFNTEVIILNEEDLKFYLDVISNWQGNVLLWE